MNLERIAEIDDGCKPLPPGGYANYYDGNSKLVHALEIAELCRLARLGLRVEGAPTVAFGGVEYNAMTGGDRREYVVRAKLVVLEDAK